MPAIGVVAPLPPQIGGVPSFAEWLLGQAPTLGVRFVPFDLWRPADGPGGGRLTAGALGLQARNGARFLRWLPRAPRVVHYCVAGNPTGLARDLLYIQLLRLARREVIGHVHSGTDLERAGPSPAYRAALRRVARLSRVTVAISPSAERLLRRHGIAASTVLNPVRLAPGRSRARRRAPGDPLSLLFVGSHGVDKGCHDLLDAVAGARARGVDARLTLVGREKHRGDEAALRRAVGRLGLDGSVTFAGPLLGGALRDAYGDADVLCLPSRAEGLPMVVLEAMAAGVPVLATRVGGVPDVVRDGESGVLVEPGDVRGLEQAIVRLAGDPTGCLALAAAAERHVQEVAAGDAVLRRWSAIYGDVLERAAGAV